MPVTVMVLMLAVFVLNGLLWVWLPARAALGKLKDDSISRGLF